MPVVWQHRVRPTYTHLSVMRAEHVRAMLPTCRGARPARRGVRGLCRRDEANAPSALVGMVAEPLVNRPLDTARLLELAGHPRLGLHRVAGMQMLLHQVAADPKDSHLVELLALVVQAKVAGTPGLDDPFAANDPAAGVLPQEKVGRLPLLSLATGEVLSMAVGDLRRNLLLVGPTGGGKSNTLRAIIASASMHPNCTVLVFTRKHDLQESEILRRLDPPVVFLEWQDVRAALLQVPQGCDARSYINGVVGLVADNLSLMASRRLMLSTLYRLLEDHAGSGSWPTLSAWIEAIKQVKPRGGYREAQYQEAALYALGELRLSTGRVFDYSVSNFVERLVNHRGVVSICTGGLPASIASLFTCLVLHWAFETRAERDADRLCITVLDDALPLLHGSLGSEAEGGPRPLSTWSFMGRSRGLGLVGACQNFSLVSPALRNNCGTLVVCGGSLGQDARELAMHLHLTKAQEQYLTQMQTGQALVFAPKVWPKPVVGRVPLLP